MIEKLGEPTSLGPRDLASRAAPARPSAAPAGRLSLTGIWSRRRMYAFDGWCRPSTAS